MADEKKTVGSNKKNKKKKKNNKAFKTAVITVTVISLIFIVSVVLFAVLSVFRQNAEEKLNKSVYPIKYENYVEKYCKEFDVDKCLVYAVIKTESNFDPNAESPVGAIGLMQLMPDTFTWIQNYRTAFQPDKIIDSKELYKPKLNIEYGVYLLRYLLDMYDGNTELAICSYNAGNGNIDDWLAQGIITRDNVDPDNIPFPETANYLRRVTTAMDMYRQLYFSDYTYTYSKAEWEQTDIDTSEASGDSSDPNDNIYEDTVSETEEIYTEESSNNKADYYNDIDIYDNNEYYEY